MLCFFAVEARFFNKSVTTLLAQTIANLSQFTKGLGLKERIPSKGSRREKERTFKFFPLE